MTSGRPESGREPDLFNVGRQRVLRAPASRLVRLQRYPWLPLRIGLLTDRRADVGAAKFQAGTR